jgi:hypothetical protein
MYQSSCTIYCFAHLFTDFDLKVALYIHVRIYVVLAICYPKTLYAMKKEIVVIDFARASKLYIYDIADLGTGFLLSPPLVTLLFTMLRPLLRDAFT